MGIEIAVLVSSFERPKHLARVLASIEHQRGVGDRLEVVVTDDGSSDESPQIVEAFARRVSFPVQLTTHDRNGFQLARCRNEGVVASKAPYLLFLDGDCLIPADHVRRHLSRRQPGAVQAGYCCLLDRDVSKNLTLDQIARGEFCAAASQCERKKLARMHRKAQLYSWVRHPTKPKLYGGNIGVFRSDYERINGYDENFEGWGCEDDDLRFRLRRSGIRIRSILDITCTYHLWHPPGTTTPANWRDGHNVDYLRRADRPSYCLNGLSTYDSGPRNVRVQQWSATSELSAITTGDRC